MSKINKKARLIGVDNNVSYAYNHENTRVSKTVNAKTTHFIYDGSKLIGEYTNDGSVKNEYIYLNGTPLAVTNATQTLYIHTDHLGTPRRLADENGNIVWSWESKAFGDDEAVGSVKFDLRFAGQYFDSETKTHYNINRDYNPKTGRYIESDPIGFDGGVNSYGYVAGNPLGAVDELGLYADVIFEREKQALSIQNNGKKRLYVHAFSGGHWDGKMITRTIPNHNPIPKGDYFITENVRPEHTGSSTWLSLLKKDDRIDDYTYEGENKRYGFRFHYGRESHGRVTLTDQKQFNDARTLIVSGTMTTVKYIAGPYLWSPIRNIKGYGKLTVK